MTFTTILYDKRDSVATITLNRPDRLNAYNVQMRDELYQLLETVRDDPEVLVTILRGAGERAFCAGADLSEFGTAPSPVIARQVRWERDVWGLFLSIKKPFIAALHGFVLGSGLEMALCCDLRIATEDAQFGLPEVSLGFIPAAGGSQTLPRAVGRGKALEMLLTCDRINAQEALRVGLVTKIVPRPALLPEAEAVAQKLLSFDPEVLRLTKEAVTRGLDMPLSEGLAQERRLAAVVFSRRRGRQHSP